VQFDFLGYAFRPRWVKGRSGDVFVGFNPGIRPKSATAIRQTMRDWRLHHRSELSLEDVARRVNPVLRGWINYYGSYFRSTLNRVLAHFDEDLSQWAMKKYKSLKRRHLWASSWVRGVMLRQPKLFAHWAAVQATVR
jgi:RNA-directed DNA polymerase